MLTKQQMLAALDGLIDEWRRLHAVFLNDLLPWSPQFVVWLKAAESTVETIFGSASEAFLSFKSTHFVPPPGQQFANDVEKRNAELIWFDSGLRYSVNTLIGYRYSVERLAAEPPARPTPYTFISHGGPAITHVDATRDFLQALGLSPIVVRDMPNLNFSVNEKVHAYMSICTAAVALATVEDETTAQEHRARPNVENEIGMLQSAENINSRIIYMKESGVNLHRTTKRRFGFYSTRSACRTLSFRLRESSRRSDCLDSYAFTEILQRRRQFVRRSDLKVTEVRASQTERAVYGASPFEHLAR